MELIDVLDKEIEECIKKFQNAKTGAEVKTFIIEYEKLMLQREKEFTRVVMEEQSEKKQTSKTEETLQRIERTLERIEKMLTTRSPITIDGAVIGDAVIQQNLGSRKQ